MSKLRMIAALAALLAMTAPDVKFIPGHGPISTSSDLRKYVNLLKETRALVAQAAKEGKSLDDMKKARLLVNYEDLGKGFIKVDGWLDVLHADLQHKPSADALYQKHGHEDEK